MQRMTGFDALFIYDESPTEPQHTLKVSILSSEASADYSFALAKRRMASRLPRLEPLRWRAVRVPFDLHHPVWVEDPELDLDHHVRRLAIPAPAGRRELCEMISEIASTQLDPERPLWECWFLEGFEGDKVVTVFKVSHALADGGASKELLERSLAPCRAAGVLPENELDAPRPAPLPSRTRLVLDAFRDIGRDTLVNGPRLAARTVAAMWRSRGQRSREGAADRPSPLRGPRRIFGGALSRRRRFDFFTVPFAQARSVKSVFDVTINDVLIASVAGGVRRYLEERGELPAGPLIGNMPASRLEPGQHPAFGNHLTNRSLWLPTHLEDPIERLYAAHETAADAKRDIVRRAGAQAEQWIEILPPFLVKRVGMVMRMIIRATQASGGVVISNVAGPRQPLYTESGMVENFISVGHMKFVAGLNVTVWSYGDNLNFGFYGCGRAIPDLWRVAHYVEGSFSELVVAAERRHSQAA